jgi:hypothetical protein
MKTKIASKTASVSHVILAQASGVTDPLPTESAPSPPEGYVPTKVGRGFRPQRAQISIATKAAGELRSLTTYTEYFGTAAPDQVSVAEALTNAAAWTSKLQNATIWYQYLKQQEGLAWKHALSLTEPLRVPFEFRLSRDATVEQQLPSVAKFFAAAKDTAKKSVATRKKNAADKAAAAKKAAAAASSSAVPASAVTDPVKAAAVKLLN